MLSKAALPLSAGGQEEYASVMAFVWKLLVLLAVLFMPFGMAGASAATPDSAPMAGMPMGHCPDQTPKHDRQGGIAPCTMACAAALPAMDVATELLELSPETGLPRAVEAMHGLHPDIATPPPKRS